MKKTLAALTLVAALTIAGCSAPAQVSGNGGDTTHVVASTNVYGSLAELIGGDRVTVTSIITSVTQDPHSYEASPRDRLTVDRAQLVIENGGGYDAFMTSLTADADAVVISAVHFAPGYTGQAHDHGDHGDHGDHADHDDHDDHDAEDDADHSSFNEHVWFDPHTMIHLVQNIAAELTALDPDGEAKFTAAADALVIELEGFESDLADLKAAASGAGVFLTEPIAGHLVEAGGLKDFAPAGFASAVEAGNDVSPSILLDALAVIDSGDVVAVLSNAQTGGTETQRVEEAAKAAGIPVVTFTELLEDGSSYTDWMSSAIERLSAAVVQ